MFNHMETKSVLSRQLAAALITLWIATSTALTVWAMKNKDEQVPSALLNLSVVKSVQESTTDAIIIFQTGQKGRLSRNHEDYQSRLILAQRSVERQHPVGVRINSAGEIAEIVRADNDLVAFLAKESENIVKVGFQGHDGIAYLERQHPCFDKIERDLHLSLKKKKRIWFVWRLPKLTLEDVMIVEGER